MNNVAFSCCPRINFKEGWWRKPIFESQNIIICLDFLDLWRETCCINHLKSFSTVRAHWIFNMDTVFIMAVSQNCVCSDDLLRAFTKLFRLIYISLNVAASPRMIKRTLTCVCLSGGPLILQPLCPNPNSCTHPFYYRLVVWCLPKRCLNGVLLPQHIQPRACRCMCVSKTAIFRDEAFASKPTE